jgi:4-oxalocrotonate tautomerase
VPIVRIDPLEGRSPQELSRLADGVHRALMETLDVPERDRFQVIREHDRAHVHFDRSYLDIERSDAWILVEVTLSRGRPTEKKQAFYSRLSELLGRDLRGELRGPAARTVALMSGTR